MIIALPPAIKCPVGRKRAPPLHTVGRSLLRSGFDSVSKRLLLSSYKTAKARVEGKADPAGVWRPDTDYFSLLSALQSARRCWWTAATRLRRRTLTSPPASCEMPPRLDCDICLRLPPPLPFSPHLFARRVPMTSAEPETPLWAVTSPALSTAWLVGAPLRPSSLRTARQLLALHSFRSDRRISLIVVALSRGTYRQTFIRAQHLTDGASMGLYTPRADLARQATRAPARKRGRRALTLYRNGKHTFFQFYAMHHHA
jgi:hypothetical protein